MLHRDLQSMVYMHFFHEAGIRSFELWMMLSKAEVSDIFSKTKDKFFVLEGVISNPRCPLFEQVHCKAFNNFFLLHRHSQLYTKMKLHNLFLFSSLALGTLASPAPARIQIRATPTYTLTR